ncbi:hypothetical protein Tco_0553799 [Tanacetum coccineum]
MVDSKNLLDRFPAQSVGSSNTDVLDSPCLLVLITGTSQSRQHGVFLGIWNYGGQYANDWRSAPTLGFPHQSEGNHNRMAGSDAREATQISKSLLQVIIPTLQARGREAANAMSWNDFKALLVEEFCPSNEMERLENEFWNHKMIGANHVGIKRYMAGLALRLRGMLRINERKSMDEPAKVGGSGRDVKKAKRGTNFVATAPSREGYAGSQPCYDILDELDHGSTCGIRAGGS